MANILLPLGFAVAVICSAASQASAEAASGDAALEPFAVHINRTPKQAWPGYGIYLGSGLVLTAAHVPGDVAKTKPRVVIGGQDLPASLVKQGSLDQTDLTLLSVDAAKLPVRLQMRRLPLCQRPPYPGESVVVVIPEGAARSRVLPPNMIPPRIRGRFDTLIGDVATTGNSGSGVFDVLNQCLLGIMSRKISIGLGATRPGGPVQTRDIAKYFVPVGEIKAFIPDSVSF